MKEEKFLKKRKNTLDKEYYPRGWKKNYREEKIISIETENNGKFTLKQH